jgi:hypothetical protein
MRETFAMTKGFTGSFLLAADAPGLSTPKAQ